MIRLWQSIQLSEEDDLSSGDMEKECVKDKALKDEEGWGWHFHVRYLSLPRGRLPIYAGEISGRPRDELWQGLSSRPHESSAPI